MQSLAKQKLQLGNLYSNSGPISEVWLSLHTIHVHRLPSRSSRLTRSKRTMCGKTCCVRLSSCAACATRTSFDCTRQWRPITCTALLRRLPRVESYSHMFEMTSRKSICLRRRHVHSSASWCQRCIISTVLLLCTGKLAIPVERWFKSIGNTENRYSSADTVAHSLLQSKDPEKDDSCCQVQQPSLKLETMTVQWTYLWDWTAYSSFVHCVTLC